MGREGQVLVSARWALLPPDAARGIISDPFSVLLCSRVSCSETHSYLH